MEPRQNQQGFDEVMIVNPYDPTDDNQGATLMNFSELSDDPGQPFEWDGYGALAEDEPYLGEADYEDDAYGFDDEDFGESIPYEDEYGEFDDYYAEEPYFGQFAEGEPFYSEVDPYYGEAEYLDDEYGYADVDAYGFAEDYDFDDGYGEDDYYYGYPAGYGGYLGDYAEEYVPEPIGYYADDYGYDGYPLAAYDDYGTRYGQVPEMVGYGEYDAYDDYYGGSDIGAYVPEVAPSFNAGCPLPTNVAGFGDDYDDLEGYVTPRSVNATCKQFVTPRGYTTAIPETFRPLW